MHVYVKLIHELCVCVCATANVLKLLPQTPSDDSRRPSPAIGERKRTRTLLTIARRVSSSKIYTQVCIYIAFVTAFVINYSRAEVALSSLTPATTFNLPSEILMTRCFPFTIGEVSFCIL